MDMAHFTLGIAPQTAVLHAPGMSQQVRRPISVWLVMLLSGAYGVATIVGLVRDSPANIAASTWYEWLFALDGLFVALPACWLLWKRRPIGVWFGLVFLGLFGAFGIAATIHRAEGSMSMGSFAELLFFISFVLAFAYWFACSKASRAFFLQQ
jgi:hypothetical protein